MRFDFQLSCGDDIAFPGPELWRQRQVMQLVADHQGVRDSLGGSLLPDRGRQGHPSEDRGIHGYPVNWILIEASKPTVRSNGTTSLRGALRSTTVQEELDGLLRAASDVANGWPGWLADARFPRPRPAAALGSAGPGAAVQLQMGARAWAARAFLDTAVRPPGQVACTMSLASRSWRPAAPGCSSRRTGRTLRVHPCC